MYNVKYIYISKFQRQRFRVLMKKALSSEHGKRTERLQMIQTKKVTVIAASRK